MKQLKNCKDNGNGSINIPEELDFMLLAKMFLEHSDKIKDVEYKFANYRKHWRFAYDEKLTRATSNTETLKNYTYKEIILDSFAIWIFLFYLKLEQCDYKKSYSSIFIEDNYMDQILEFQIASDYIGSEISSEYVSGLI